VPVAGPAAPNVLELERRLRAEGLDPDGWNNGPGDLYQAHRHAYDKVIVVAAGSITFGLAGSSAVVAQINLAVGDRLELPAGTDHDAVVGPAGVACLEAHLPSGTLSAPRWVPAGEW
jgi:uncharacterized protein YjlB